MDSPVTVRPGMNGLSLKMGFTGRSNVVEGFIVFDRERASNPFPINRRLHLRCSRFRSRLSEKS